MASGIYGNGLIDEDLNRFIGVCYDDVLFWCVLLLLLLHIFCWGGGLLLSCVGFFYTLVKNFEREREMLYLTTHSTHFIYGYMGSDIWLRTILIVRKETRCRHIGYSYILTARFFLYAPSHRQDTPVVDHWMEREIAQWVHPMKDRSDDPSHHERTLYLWATSRSCEHFCFQR